MPNPDPKPALVELEKAIKSTLGLLNTLEAALQSSKGALNVNITRSVPTEANASFESSEEPNALALLSDSAKLLKAHTTKLSLLLLNEPYTPSEITLIIKDALAQSIIPAMAGGLHLCVPEKYGSLIQEYAKAELQITWNELKHLLSSVPITSCPDLSENARGRQDILGSTGRLWAQCDKLVQLGGRGVVWLVSEKVEAFEGLFKDAIAELEDWDPDGEDGENDDEEDEPENDAKNINGLNELTISTSNGDISHSNQASIAEGKAWALKYLRMTKLLFPALRKRRISKFPNVTSSTTAEDWPGGAALGRVREISTLARHFSDCADDIAQALYAFSTEDLAASLEALRKQSEACLELYKVSWTGEADEFTSWADNWLHRLQEYEKERLSNTDEG